MEVATEMSSSIYESKTAKKVYLYRNGAINADPKCLIVNQRQVRDFGTFLTRVTSGLKAPVAIRNIYTPAGGHKVKSLDALESGRYYVAGGSEQFKKIKYGNSSPQKLLSRRPTRKELPIPSRMHQAVVASARYKKPVEKPFVIHVFRNGDFRYRGARVLLPRRIMGSWEHVLEIVTEKADLFTPAKRLCTLDGHIVYAVSELQDGGKYVAIEGTKPFQRVAYCANDDSKALMHTFPKAAIRLQRGPRRRPLYRAQQGAAGSGDGVVSDPGKTPVPPLSLTRRLQKTDKRKARPMAGRKNKEAREKAIEDHRADSIFGGSPTRELENPLDGPSMKKDGSPSHHPLSKNETATTTTTTTKDTDTDFSAAEIKPAVAGVFHAQDKQQEQKQTEYIEDSQETVFKAKTQGADVEDAEVVVESKETEVERPLDQEEAEEVEEEREEFEGEGEATLDNKVSQSVELQPTAQPLHTSIDLSANRTQPTTSISTEAATTGQQRYSPAELETTPPQGDDDTKLKAGSASSSSKASRGSRKRSSSVGSTPVGEAQRTDSSSRLSKDGERNGVEQEKQDGDGAGGDVTNPPEEEIEEDIPETMAQSDQSAANDGTAESQPEQVSPPPASEPEPVKEAQLDKEEKRDPNSTGDGEAASSPEQQVDTSAQEEIVEEVDTSVQDDTGSSQKEGDEATTTFIIEDLQEQSQQDS